MQFTQTGPTVAEAPDGTLVELVDRHHAKLVGPMGTWRVELRPAEDDDWLTVKVYADTIERPGARSGEGDSDAALSHVVAGLRALRVRVRLSESEDISVVRWV